MLNGKNPKDLTNDEMYEIFINMIKNSTDEDLAKCMKLDVFDENEKYVIGKISFMYAFDENEEYLTFAVLYVDETNMKVICIENEKVIAKFERNKDTNGWSNIQPVEDVSIKLSDISKVVTRLKRLLEK